MSDWSDEETDDPTHADRRNFYKVEKWSRDGQRVVDMLFAGSNLDKARRIFDRMTKHRPRIRLTIRQRRRVVQHRDRAAAMRALSRPKVGYTYFNATTALNFRPFLA
jgi:hypothetical protein